MSNEIEYRTCRDILDTDKKQAILIKALEQYIKRCNGIANSAPRGYGSVSELEKKKQWAEEAKAAEDLLSDFLTEMN